MGDYILADKLYGFSIESGDVLRTKDGQEILVKSVNSVDDGYDIYNTDLFEDEEGMYHLEEDDTIDLLIIE